MAASVFPTRLADLSLNDSSHNPSLYANIRSIRRSALSIPNRLKSILEDANFAKQVSKYYNLPLVANERCGSWYIHPSDKGGSTYFKSTDGHHGQWDFSPRRLNLQLLRILTAHGGAVIVDSTRRGKNLPDAFSKTVPIWVAVVNKALFPEDDRAHHLQSPPRPGNLATSEISQIDARLDSFTATFRSLGLDIKALRTELRRPIRISWAINGFYDTDCGSSDLYPSTLPSVLGQSCHHLVLCSASHRVLGAEASEGGYIQGAGDDNESWSHGLSAQLFWQHKDLLMQTSENALPTLIEDLVKHEYDVSQTSVQTTSIVQVPNIHIGSGRLGTAKEFELVINCEGAPSGPVSNILWLGCRSGKTGSKDLREKLPEAVDAVDKQLMSDAQSQILITCSTGKDLSVGLAAAVLCLFYDGQGRLLEKRTNAKIDKQLVKQRLAWITCSKSDANPSRATLQAVNSFLIQRPK